ncbi:phage minor capsid protein [Lysinibacillus sp. NPDC098008]|uniref:phage minor capsid protein n=1 Tax=Lysinibacillus sp. NPDC098008 TaxID=3364146 RepID=UPI00382FE822
MSQKPYSLAEYNRRSKQAEDIHQSLVKAYETSRIYIQMQLMQSASFDIENTDKLRTRNEQLLLNINNALDKLKEYENQNLPQLLLERHSLGKYWALFNLQQSGIVLPDTSQRFTKIDEYAISNVVNQTMQSMEAARAGVISNATYNMQTTLNEAVLRNLITGKSLKDSGPELAELLKAKGIDSITKKNGVQMDLVEYAKSKLHQGVMVAHNKGTEAMLLDEEIYFVTYTTHKTECETCKKEVFSGGKKVVYSIHPDITELEDGRKVKYLGNTKGGSGQIHFKCRHVLVPFVVEFEDPDNFATTGKDEKEEE